MLMGRLSAMTKRIYDTTLFMGLLGRIPILAQRDHGLFLGGSYDD